MYIINTQKAREKKPVCWKENGYSKSMGTDGINSKSRSNFWRPQISVPLPLWTAAYFHNCHNINITSCQSNSHCSPFRAGKKRIPIGSHFILVLSCYKISNQKCFLPSSVYSLNLKYQKNSNRANYHLLKVWNGNSWQSEDKTKKWTLPSLDKRETPWVYMHTLSHLQQLLWYNL